MARVMPRACARGYHEKPWPALVGPSNASGGPDVHRDYPRDRLLNHARITKNTAPAGTSSFNIQRSSFDILFFLTTAYRLVHCQGRKCGWHSPQGAVLSRLLQREHGWTSSRRAGMPPTFSPIPSLASFAQFAAIDFFSTTLLSQSCSALKLHMRFSGPRGR